MIKGLIYQGDIIITNIYTPNIKTPKYIKHIPTDVKGETDNNIIIVGDINTPLSTMDRSFRE